MILNVHFQAPSQKGNQTTPAIMKTVLKCYILLVYILGWNDQECAYMRYFACESKNESVISIIKKDSRSNHAISLLKILCENYEINSHTI